MLRPGQPAPWFLAPSPVNPQFAFGSLGGRFMLMVFLPEPGAARDVALEHLRAHRDLFDDDKVHAFAVARDQPTMAAAQNTRSLRWFFDPDGKVSRLYHALGDQGANPHWILIDPSMRIYAVAPIDGGDAMMRLVAQLPQPDDHAGTALHAPVLIVPRILEPDICRQLIAFYDEHGGSPSGVMREINGRVMPIMDHTKRRRDAMIEDEGLRALLRQRLQTRLLPEINKAFQFQATRVERYLVACYNSDGGGFFQPHRDNTTRATAHRQFACSINLDTDGHEGGDLRFPEFGSKTYRPPSGGAVVFSCSLMHEATPVTAGKRYCFLPFFYNDAAAKIRERYLAEEAAAEAAKAAEPERQTA